MGVKHHEGRQEDVVGKEQGCNQEKSAFEADLDPGKISTTC